MKKITKIIPMILACLLTFGACNNGASGGATAVNPQTPAEEHLQTENTLHKVSVTETNKPFVVNGQSEYKILVPADMNTTIVTAANYFAKYVKEATGCQLPVESNESYTWNANEKWIVFGRSELFTSAGLSMPTDDLGISGYYIKTVGNSVFVAVEESFGYQRAALSLLKHIVGYEMYWEDTVVFEKTGETIPNMEIIERPDFAFYIESNVIAGDGKYGMGFNKSILIPVEGAEQHNTFKYLPPETYQKNHDKWYSINDQGKTGNGTQLCFNARGDEGEREIMVKEMANKVLYYADQYPDRATITITQEDTFTWCGCDTCLQMKEDYNGSNAASAIKFVNDVDDLVQSELERRAEENNTTKRPLNIITFSYRESAAPPATLNEDGTYSPVDDSVVCNPTVGVYIAPIESNYQETFYSNANATARESIKGWASVCENIYMWIYDTNFFNYLFPLNTWDSKIQTYRFLKEYNAYFVHSQSQWDNGAVSHFSRFKDYIDAKASFDVNVNYNDLADKFFKNYFGPAEKPMRTFFDTLQSYMEYLAVQHPSVVVGGYKESIGESYLWPQGTIESYLRLIDEAYEEIEILKESDPDMYEVYKEHILLESMFPRYAMLSFYSGAYNADELYVERLQFKMDCASLGIRMYEEQNSIEEIWSSWGV